MLDSRAKALEKDDIEGFLAPTTEIVKATELPLAEGSTRVPIVSVEMSLARSADLLAGRYTDVKVNLIYRYEGLPEDNSFHLQFVYSIEKRGGSWTVTKSSLGDQTILPIWATGEIQISRFGSFLAFHRPGAPDVDKTLQLAQQARGELEAKIGKQLEPAYLMVLAKNRTEYEQLVASESPVSAIAQAETTYQVSPSSIRVESRYVVVNLDQLYMQSKPVETLTHELGHLALAVDTRPFTPVWVSESAAMYLAGTRPRSTWKTGVRQGKFDEIEFAALSRVSSLGQHDPTGEAASFEYAYAAAAAYFLIETYGADKYWEFYSSFGHVPAQTVYERIPDSSNPLESRAVLLALGEETATLQLQKIFSLGIGSLDAAVRDWIKKQSR